MESLLGLISSFGISNPNIGDVFGLVSILGLTFPTLYMLLSKAENKTKAVEAKKSVEVETDQKPEVVKEELKIVEEPTIVEQTVAPIVKDEKAPTPKPTPKPTISWQDRLKKGLSRSRGEIWGKLGNLFSGKNLSADALEEVEELLYSSDLGPEMVTELVEHLEIEAKKSDLSEERFKSLLFEFLKNKMHTVQSEVDVDLFQYTKTESYTGPKVIMIVGVNGAGKTTTIGKLATKLTNQGAKVMVGACDTFRAAAVDQLEVWCERAGAHMIRAKEGSNPTGVAYEALQKAISEKADYCLLDTAGRLHTAGNLMDELAKSKRVLAKLDETAPHHTLLVLDAITGQNALRQAEEFNKALNLSGLIFTKCDGSSKAGSAISIVKNLQVPITYIGVGEMVEDLDIFNLDEYLTALLDMPNIISKSTQLT